MSKELPNINAKPFEEALETIKPRLINLLNIDERNEHAQIFDMNPLEGRDELIKILKIMINPDICLTNEQQDRLFNDMGDYLKNPDQTKLLAMVAVINSYRNECFKCLNNNCLKRDPDFPLE